MKAKWIEDKCGYACSDHASWTRAGYPSAFPFETAFSEYNPDIHTPKDTMEKLDAGHGLNYLKLSLAFAVEMAEATAATDSAPAPSKQPRAPRGSAWPSLTSRSVRSLTKLGEGRVRERIRSLFVSVSLRKRRPVERHRGREQEPMEG